MCARDLLFVMSSVVMCVCVCRYTHNTLMHDTEHFDARSSPSKAGRPCNIPVYACVYVCTYIYAYVYVYVYEYVYAIVYDDNHLLNAIVYDDNHLCI